MSDNPQDSPDHSSFPEPKSGGGGHKGLFIVLGIIAVVLAAFCYDTFVVPGTVQAGFDKVADAQLKSLAEEKSLSNVAVREVLGKEPAKSYDSGEEHFEVFHWTGGMIFNSHKLYTIYRKQGDDWVLNRHSLYSEDAPEKALSVVQADVEESDPEYGMDSAGGGPPAGGPSENDDSGSASRPELEDEDQPEGDSESVSPEEDESQN